MFSDLFPKIWESCIDSLALGSLVGDNGEQVFHSQGSPPYCAYCGLWVQSSLIVSNQLESERLQTIYMTTYSHSISILESSCQDLT